MSTETDPFCPRCEVGLAEMVNELVAARTVLLIQERDLARMTAALSDAMIAKLEAEVKRLELELADMGTLARAIAGAEAS